MIKINLHLFSLLLLLVFMNFTFAEVHAFQKVDQLLVLKTKKSLFDSPDKNTNTKQLIDPQIIKTIKKQNDWYAIETKNGEKWITNASVITNFKQTKVNKTYLLGTNKIAVPIPFFINDRISIPKGTVVKAMYEGNGFIQVTYHNNSYWIKNDRTLKPFEQSVQPINKKLVFNTKKVLFSLPSQHANTKQQVDIQMMTAKKQFNNWYAIDTENRERWVTDSSVQEYAPDKTEENNRLFLTKPRLGYFTPALLSTNAVIPKESEVTIIERWNDWISVDYNGKNYYLKSPSYETNLVPANPQSAGELINKELLLKTDNELFTYPSTLYGTGKLIDEHFILATRQWKTWYLINNGQEQLWINRDNIIEDFNPIPFEKTYKLTANKQIYIAPLYDAERITVETETEVKAVRRWNEWGEIEYQGKKYWILDE
ncbi:hypothetical protein [Metabacillus sediminilitoris]|uniref:SH3 domain-containing protein n=1 Tax=Metabacillus sediminilitoris TaxID=2567941 RepID=A0A4S4C1D2_9BACI|nr:hypothetical protein [Metabacillus sediminilitoris]QGQ48178.1 hypothetical protein GMB29_24700 [Metabacillus sediminilitoris]THF81461.1 hypothetical protein E6W99_06010 [Metabacillus sediminilitoris]